MACLTCFNAFAEADNQLYNPAYGLWRADGKADNLFKGSVHVVPVKAAPSFKFSEMLLIYDSRENAFLCSDFSEEHHEMVCSLVKITKKDIQPEDRADLVTTEIADTPYFMMMLKVDNDNLKIMGSRLDNADCILEHNCPFEELSNLNREPFVNSRFYHKLTPFSQISWETHLTPSKKLTRNSEGDEIEEKCWMYENHRSSISMVCIMEYSDKNQERLFYTYKIRPCIANPVIAKICTCQIEVEEKVSDMDDRIYYSGEGSTATFCLD